MKSQRTHRKIPRTPADRKRIAAARAKFDAERPTLEELTRTGDYEAVPHGDYLSLLDVVRGLKLERQRQGVSLSDLARRSGIDKAALSRLESGQVPNPTIGTLWKIAQAIGKRIVLSFHDDLAQKPAR